ncbi:unnamed protein product [Linum tenue]|uniref:Myb/SANT-like domain-containing protein n=1 Tax=Linum tenue TaxID=586396 RepID=A0AAV0NNX3_9ROSI|nr:unnamed protein product [Linum tenue]
MMELAQRHQAENESFNNRTFSELQYMMEERAPGCGVRVEPHIRSRHKFLKDFHDVHLLRNQSRCGWDDVTKTATLDDDVFENIEKVICHFNPTCIKYQ